MSPFALFRLLIAFGLLSLIACDKPTPEKYFDVAVLNSNMLVGFANSGMERELASPSVKMGKTKDEVVSMKRSEVVEQKINFAEENYEKLKGFNADDDAKDIVTNSLALHQFVLSVYKKEYRDLAKLYDEGGVASEVEAKQKLIRVNYQSKFEEFYNRLISSGKQYAAAHHIKVNWAR